MARPGIVCIDQGKSGILDSDLVSLVLLVREFSLVDILHYGVYPGGGGFAHLAYPGSGYQGIRLVIR